MRDSILAGPIMVILTGCLSVLSLYHVSAQPDSIVARPDDSATDQAAVREILEKERISLEDLLKVAELRNPEIQAAMYGMEAAAGRVRQAGFYPNPRLEFEAEDIPAGKLSFRRSVNKIAFVQPIIIGRRRLASVSASAAEYDAQSLAVRQKLREVRSGVRDVYVELSYLKQAGVLHAELLDLAQQTCQVAATRFKARAALESEVIRTRIDVQELELGQRKLNRLLASSAERLRSLLGGVSIPVEHIEGRLIEVTPELDLERLRTVVDESHPALLAARKGTEIAQRYIELARAERTPDIDVRFAYGHNTATQENSMEAGIGIPLTLFDRNQGRILETTNLASRAARNADSLANSLLATLAEAHASYLTARDEFETLRNEMVPAAETVFSQAKEVYKAGKTSLLDLLDSQRTLIKTRLLKLESLKDLNLDRARLWAVVGPEIEKQTNVKE